MLSFFFLQKYMCCNLMFAENNVRTSGTASSPASEINRVISSVVVPERESPVVDDVPAQLPTRGTNNELIVATLVVDKIIRQTDRSNDFAVQISKI